ncbi:PD-(D/E)XK nuclease family protein [Companilactobacillus nuruki]|uniref:Uncharacterized protein n=1 Tax=Companilactobacillus nuruki TaxID=1993540 RepID=A0A2N7AUH6_9LACO|nr:PD-(D/E)XK nuclease family protein [Companilactobacillus nuruki]PMD70746.1 hypothetical protein CBP76_06260 [Companilactobacillus nuruki]
MTLNFVLGKNQLDHHKEVMTLFDQDYQKDPNGQFFFLVPNHIKFESEVNILKHFNTNDKKLIATHNVQTFSFSRLAWYFLRDSKDYNLETLTQTKAAMILKNIVTNQQNELKVFKHMIDKPGFIDQMITQFQEFIDGQVQPDDIENVLQSDNDVFADKIKDLNLIYSSYLNAIQNYNTNDVQLDALAQFLNEKPDTSHYHFYIEGFSTFTATEMNLVKSMIINSNDLILSLVLENNSLDSTDATDFYYRPAKTYQQLLDFANSQKLPSKNYFAKDLRINNDLIKIEDYWIQSNEGKIPKNSKGHLNDQSTVQVWKSTDKQTEVSAVGGYIRRMVARQNYRYKDFLIVSRNLSEYSSFIESFMENNEIPYFIDLQKKMANHPFKRLIDLLFALKNGMQEDDVISLLRTELLIPDEFKDDIIGFRQAVDLTENYALAHGIGQRSWLGGEFKPMVKLDPEVDQIKINEFEQINLIKNYVKNVYSQLKRFWDEKSNSIDSVSFLYSFLTEKHVFDVLLRWQKQATEDNNLTLANQPEQIINLFNQILDEYISIFGDEKFKAEDFISILDAAFENATYSQIPSTLDAVSISEIGMIQPNNRKITIILGATSSNMPGATVSNNLVTDDERGYLNDNLNDGKYLPESDEVVNNAEPFLHDLIFTTGSDKLIFTYPNLSEDGKQQELSSYVKRIVDYFDLAIQDKLANPASDDVEANDILEYVSSKAATLNYLIRVMRSGLDKNEKIPNGWEYIKNQLIKEKPQETNLALTSLNYDNIPHDLNPETVADLYGKNINVSISQLETFYMNQYEYFLRYGLRLFPRQLFEITPAQTGSIFHAVLDGMVKKMNGEGTSFKDYAGKDEEIKIIVDELFNQQLQDPINMIFDASSRMRYISSKIKSTLVQLIKNMAVQGTRSNFVPKKSEVKFGRFEGKEDIPRLSYPLTDGHLINVRGKIDRIDEMLLDDEKAFLTIIDYKSSSRIFDYNQFLEGLTMQMPTYLQALDNSLDLFDVNGVEPKLGAAVYEHISNPFLNLEKNMQEDQLRKKLLSKYKLEGILLDDSDLLENFDTEARTKAGKFSKVSPVANFRNDIVSEEELNDILKYNQKKIIEAGETIYSGKLKLNPYRYKKITGLQYSDYRPIFEFDAMLKSNEYHDITEYGKAMVIKMIDKEINQEGGQNA